jgi:D-beta-D-heptose 7-phosphate kinase/D-beta-D-heptose 1-phosphate adenosyltransferase
MKPILILGDSCVDEFVYCDCKRLCPEAPVPLLDIKETSQNRGMAGNVYRNLRAFTHNCVFLTNKNNRAVVKTRYVERKTNHMFIRIDTGVPSSPLSELQKNNLDFENYSAIIISDYNKGFLCETDIQYIAQNHPLTFLDTKKVLGAWANDVSFIKINRPETLNTKHTLTDELASKLITTLGDDGASYRGKQYDVEPVEIKHVSGAGDTFLATLVYTYVQTEDIDNSIEMANRGATYVVQCKGVSCVDASLISRELNLSEQ